jgi:hypothetical protein
MGGSMKCWDCGQELDTQQIEKDAAARERLMLASVVEQSARILQESGDPGWRAMLALSDELNAQRGV